VGQISTVRKHGHILKSYMKWKTHVTGSRIARSGSGFQDPGGAAAYTNHTRRGKKNNRGKDWTGIWWDCRIHRSHKREKKNKRGRTELRTHRSCAAWKMIWRQSGSYLGELDGGSDIFWSMRLAAVILQASTTKQNVSTPAVTLSRSYFHNIIDGHINKSYMRHGLN